LVCVGACIAPDSGFGSRQGIPLNQATSSSSIVYQNTVSIAYPGPQQAGGLNVVVVGWNDSSSTITSVADTNGNKYFLAAGTTDATGPDVSQAIYVASNIIGAEYSYGHV